MKAGILTQILVCRKVGTKAEDFANTAKELGYTMFAFNGWVFSTNEVMGSGNETPGSITTIKPLFTLSDLVDYKFNP